MLYGFAGGLRMPVTDRLSVSGEAFYAPLTVKRPTDSDSQIEGLLNVRGLLEVRF